MTDIKILVCCHRDDIRAGEPPYLPIHVGKALSPLELGITCDNTGDNISEKNPSYCELTGMYWAWKNLKSVDIIGLCHYRRYFDFHGQCPPLMPHLQCPPSRLASLNLTVPESIVEAVSQGKVVTAQPLHYIHNIAMNYYMLYLSDDFRTLRQAVVQAEGGRYAHAFDRAMLRSNSFAPYNMFLMRWDDFDRYCSWLFNVLARVESHTDISHYTPFQKRIFGFMAERLLNVWLVAEKPRQTIRKPVIMLSDQPANHNWLAYLCVRLYRDAVFALTAMENRKQARDL